MTNVTDVPEPLQLPAVLDLKEAVPLARTMLERRGTDLELDAAPVERIGGQCLQVLLSARMTWDADGRRFIVRGFTDDVVATLGLLGITPDALQCRKGEAA